MAYLLRIIRRKLSTPVLLLLIILLMWYSVFMLENFMRNNQDTESDTYEMKVQKAIEESTFIQNFDQQIPLQPPEKQEELEEKIVVPPAVAEDVHLENEFQNKELEVKVKDMEEEEEIPENDEKEHENLQINPPINEMPKVDVMLKEGLGENGKPVNISKNSLNEEEKEEYERGWKNNAFNEYLSNRISLDRTLEDPRDEKCKLIKYSDNLPEASVIVTFHNEAWSVLLRSVHSIVNRTPEKLLKEIILVDDFSHMAHLGRPLEEYMSNYNKKVKIERAPSREGLIRARLRGYRAASGTALVFLDSHIECAPGWIEPMLDRIGQNWTTVVTPSIDVVNDDTFGFQYQEAKATNVGGFDWGLVFTWHPVPEAERKRRNYEDHTPVRSPTMAGGLFAIDRKYFEYIGTYDDGMDIWGGENLEISFRIWMCGGTLETTPCSHVGHIFRKRSPYKWRENVNVLLKNNVRLAEVWLDNYKYYYYSRIGNNLGEYGNVSSRIELRKRLQCKSFEWFLKSVYPEMWVPGESGAWGQIAAKSKSSRCLSGVTDYGQTGKNLKLVNCSQAWELWYWTVGKEIRRDYGCFDYSGRPDIQVESCHQMGGNQLWEFREDNTLYHVSSQKCLEISEDGTKVFMNKCIGTDFQIWLWNREHPDGPTRNWNSPD